MWACMVERKREKDREEEDKSKIGWVLSMCVCALEFCLRLCACEIMYARVCV